MKPLASTGSTRSESGLTLVELLLYMSLSIIVLLVAGAMLNTSTRAQSQVDRTTAASNTGQLVMRSVQSGVRNATQVGLTASNGTQLLTVTTSGGLTPVVWSCEAWYFTPSSGGSLYMLRTAATAPIQAPTSSTIGSWTLLGTGISLNGAAVFTATAGLVTLTLNIDTGNPTPLSLTSPASTLNLVTVGTACFP
jgi:type II secretory pathway pseudopilin PulG